MATKRDNSREPNRDCSREREARGRGGGGAGSLLARVKTLEEQVAAQIHLMTEDQQREMAAQRVKRRELEQKQEKLEAALAEWLRRTEEEERQAPTVVVWQARLKAKEAEIQCEKDRLEAANRRLTRGWTDLRDKEKELEKTESQLRQKSQEIAQAERALQNSQCAHEQRGSGQHHNHPNDHHNDCICCCPIL